MLDRSHVTRHRRGRARAALRRPAFGPAAVRERSSLRGRFRVESQPAGLGRRRHAACIDAELPLEDAAPR